MKYKEGDVIKANGRKFRVEKIDVTPVEKEVLQYDLTPLGHDIPARMKPHSSGYTLIEYRDVEPDVVEKGDSDE